MSDEQFEGGHLYCRQDTAMAVVEVGAGPEFGETEARLASSSFSAYFCSDPGQILTDQSSSENIRSGIWL